MTKGQAKILATSLFTLAIVLVVLALSFLMAGINYTSYRGIILGIIALVCAWVIMKLGMSVLRTVREET
jgi:hypothetical protein